MGAVIAGWVAGYAYGIAATMAITFLVTRPEAARLVDRVVDPGVSRPLLVVPVFIGASVLWPMMGLVLGSMYELGNFASGPGALATPSIGFAAGMLILGMLPAPILSIVWGRYWWLWVSMGLFFALSFGWLMPVLEGQW